MSCQTVFPKICGYYLSASIITLGPVPGVGASSCNSGDKTDQWVQSLMFMTIMIYHSEFDVHVTVHRDRSL